MSFSTILAIILLAILTFIIYRFIKVKSQNKKLNNQRFDRIKPLYEKIESGETLSTKDILPFAENIQTRELTYQLLNSHNKTDLFPQNYLTIEKAAESNLVNWLEFPTELGECPDEIEHIKRVTIDFDGQNNLVHYEVFKYKTYEPHWAAKSGWVLGVVGPYFDDSKPYDFPKATFSRVDSTLDKITPDEEAKWVHEHISMRRG